jgi:CheY-like chemotaxis protein
VQITGDGTDSRCEGQTMNAGNVHSERVGAAGPRRVSASLPIILTKLTGSSSTTDPIEPTKQPRRILIVDDDRDGVASLSMLLTMVGHETSIAHDGLEAVDVAAKFQPHIVLLDLGLPKFDGYEVCRRIRAADWGRSMMLVAVTGWGDEAHRKQALDAGFDMHLVKPVSAEVFMTVLAAAT